MRDLGGPIALLCVIAAGVLAPAVASASPPRASWQVEVSGACEDTFTSELLKRAPHLVLAPEAPRALRVRVGAEGGRYRGLLDVADGDATTHRDVEATSCQDVLRGLALVAALTVEQEPEAAPAAPAPAAPAPPAEAAPAEPVDMDAPPSRGAVPAPTRWDLSAGGFAEASSLLPAPLLSAGGQLAVELQRGGLLAPSSRVRLGSSLPASHDSASGRASFSWLGAGVDGCPLRWGRRIAARPCAGLDMGELTATGTDSNRISGADRRRRLWVAGRLLARLEATPVPWLSAELEGGLLLPITRDSFVFRPSEEIYRPSAAFFAALGFRVHFP